MKSIQHPIQLALAFEGKICSHCREWKPLSAYYRNRVCRDGLCYECKVCHDKVADKWRVAHPESSRRKAARWKQANPHRAKANEARYRAAYREQLVVSGHNRRAYLKGIEGSFTTQEWQDLKARYGNRCLRCFRKEPQIALAVDHIVPLSKGGTNYIENVQPLCKSCNSHKARKHICYRPDKLLRAA